MDLTGKEHARYSTMSPSFEISPDCELSLDGNRLVSVNPFSGSLDILDTFDACLVRSLKLPPSYVNHSLTVSPTPKYNVGNIAFSSDGQKLFASLFEGKVAVWDAPVTVESKRFVGHEHAVVRATFSRDDRQVVSCSDDGTVRVWAFDSGEELAVLKGHGAGIGTYLSTIYEAILSPTNDRLVSVGGDRSVRLWSVTTQEELSSSLHTVGKKLQGVSVAAFSPDGKQYATLASKGVVTVFDSVDGSLIRMLSIGSPGELIHGVLWIAYSKDGSALQAMTFQGQTRIWNTNTWEPNPDSITEFLPMPRSFSLDGRWALVPRGNDVCVVDLQRQLSSVERDRMESQKSFHGSFHLRQAKIATQENYHYAAAFHYGLYLTSEPEDSEAWAALRYACYHLVPEYAQIDSAVFELLPEHTRNLLVHDFDTNGGLENGAPRQVEDMLGRLSVSEDSVGLDSVSESQLKRARFEVLNSQSAREFYVLGLIEEAFENYQDAIAVYTCAVQLSETMQVDGEILLKARAKLAKLNAKHGNGIGGVRSKE